MGTLITITPIEDIEVDHGRKANMVVSHSFVPSQLPVCREDRSVDLSSTIPILGDVESRSRLPPGTDRVATASLDGVHAGDYIVMAAVFAAIVFLWVQ